MTDGKTMSGFLPFSRPAMGVEELAAVKEVLESGWITTGPKNQALEQAFCQLTGNQHAIAVSSATAGMHITLMALEIGKGDEVLMKVVKILDRKSTRLNSSHSSPSRMPSSA